MAFHMYVFFCFVKDESISERPIKWEMTEENNHTVLFFCLKGNLLPKYLRRPGFLFQNWYCLLSTTSIYRCILSHIIDAVILAGEGFNTVLETVETSLGAPPPEELVRSEKNDGQAETGIWTTRHFGSITRWRQVNVREGVRRSESAPLLHNWFVQGRW